MRNWHQYLIRLTEVLKHLSTDLKFGNEKVHVGIIEGLIEYKITEPIQFENPISNYVAAHDNFSDINGTRKVFGRFRNSLETNEDYPVEYLKSLDIPYFSFHATGVSGIIAAKDLNNSLNNGIVPNIRIINSNEYVDALILARINYISYNNVTSYYYKKFNSSLYLVSFSPKGFNSKIPHRLSEQTEYSKKSVAIINSSSRVAEFNIPNTIYSDDVVFILQELFAYGRDGRGVLYVFSAGNDGIVITPENRVNAKSIKSLIVAASSVNLNEGDIEQYDNNVTTIPEIVADYSNKGERIDICAPSSRTASTTTSDLSIFTTSMQFGGEIGDDEQVIIKIIINVENSSKIELNNIFGVFNGQSVEMGDPAKFSHEVRTISDVYEEEKNGIIRYYIELDENIKFTNKFDLKDKEIRITVLKTTIVSIINSNSFKILDRRGIKAVPAGNKAKKDYQKVFIYSENNSDMSQGILTQIQGVNFSKDDKFYTIEITSGVLPNNLNDLILIPDQISISAKSPQPINPSEPEKEPLSNSFICEGSLDGFFPGQLIYVSGNGKKLTTNITSLRGKTIVTDFALHEKGKSFTIKSLSYGNYTNSFGGTSAATPIVSGVAALLHSVNQDLNAAELKHILKETTDKIAGQYNIQNKKEKYNYGYSVHKKNELGTGRVNAEKAVQLALDWHSKPEVLKPELHIADKLDGGYTGNIVEVVPNDLVDSPDIWIKPLKDAASDPSVSNPFNTMDTTLDQKIYIRVRNTGNRETFAECDVRVFIAFDNDIAPKFPFPDKWYDQSDVKLIAVKSLDFIPQNSDIVVEIEWTKIAANWDIWNPADSSQNRKSAYILVHIAPFDGKFKYDDTVTPPVNLSLSDIRFNKQLTCKKIIVTHLGIKYSGNILPGNIYDIDAGSALAQESFNLDMTNVLETDLNDITIRATRTNGNATEEVNFSKSGGEWTTDNNVDWITFYEPEITDSNEANYKNAVFPHALSIDDQGNKQNVKLEIVANA